MHGTMPPSPRTAGGWNGIFTNPERSEGSVLLRGFVSAGEKQILRFAQDFQRS